MQNQDVKMNYMSRVMNVSEGQQQQRPRLFRMLQQKEAGHLQTLSTRTESLGRLLMAVVARDLQECELVMAYDSGYDDPAILHDLLLLPNLRQVRTNVYLFYKEVP